MRCGITVVNSRIDILILFFMCMGITSLFERGKPDLLLENKGTWNPQLSFSLWNLKNNRGFGTCIGIMESHVDSNKCALYEMKKLCRVVFRCERRSKEV
jgi:hypothetical protein